MGRKQTIIILNAYQVSPDFIGSGDHPIPFAELFGTDYPEEQAAEIGALQ